jgi:hypothetical protein
MISDVIEGLKKKVEDAFEISPEVLPPNPIEEKLENVSEKVPFNRFYESEGFPTSLSPSDLVPVIPDVASALEHDKEVENEVREYGTDALAWYKPFHFFRKWGIYIRWRGVSYLAYFLRKSGYNKPTETLIKCAFKTLHSHEYFHFLTEWAASFMEFTSLKPRYNHYLKFKSEREEANVEEPLANAYALKQVNAMAQRRISGFFEIQPPIYRAFKSYVSEEEFALGKRKLGAYIDIPSITHAVLKLIVHALREEPPWEVLFNAEPKDTCIWEVPLYIVVERLPSGTPSQVIQFISRPIHNVRIAAYPGDHPPRHIHVWIPADSKKYRKLCWPNYVKPLEGPPLSNKQIKRLERALHFNRMKQRIDYALNDIPAGKPCV